MNIQLNAKSMDMCFQTISLHVLKSISVCSTYVQRNSPMKLKYPLSVLRLLVGNTILLKIIILSYSIAQRYIKIASCSQVHFLHDGDLLILASSVTRAQFGSTVKAMQTVLGMDDTTSLSAPSLEELCMKMGCTQLYAFATDVLLHYTNVYINRLPHKTKRVVTRQMAELGLAAVVVCAKHRGEVKYCRTRKLNVCIPPYIGCE
jgi:hypothetical protein